MIELGPLDVLTLATIPAPGRLCWLTTRAVERRLDNLGGEVQRSLARLVHCGLAQADDGCPRRYARTVAGERVLDEARGVAS